MVASATMAQPKILNTVPPSSPHLSRVTIPGIFVTGTDTEIGKTIVAGAVADWFRRCDLRVAVCKPAATGCVRRREGLVSEDAEFLAHCADAKFPLDLICPQRWLEPLAPAVAAERAQQPLDWESVNRSLTLMSAASDVMVVEGVGGLMTPLDAKHTVRDVIAWLHLPVIVVARAGLGTINHTLLTINALRQIGANVAGVVINRYPAESASIAEESNPRAIEKWGKTPVLCVVPEEKIDRPKLPPGIVAAVNLVDWGRIAKSRD
jgi:dethiobiotin synthetase